MIIGICGKSGSGKSSLSKEIMSINNNSIHLDIDKVGHNVLTIDDVISELTIEFGNDILVNKNIDRKKLGELVFLSRKKMKILSDITWKYMMIEIDDFLTNNQSKTIILDWLLLPLTKYFDMCDFKILLDIPYDIRKERAMKRDNISKKDFDKRESSSIEYDASEFNVVLNNNNYDEYDEIKRLVKKI